MRSVGVDFGGVIVARASAGEDTTFFSDQFLNTPEVPGAIDGIARLNANAEYRNNMWLVSKANSRTQARTKLWLASHDFHKRTGIPEDQVVFTDSREEKATIAQDLEMSAFVDDQIDVLSRMIGIVPNLMHLDTSAKTEQHKLEAIQHFTSWQALTERLLDMAG